MFIVYKAFIIRGITINQILLILESDYQFVRYHRLHEDILSKNVRLSRLIKNKLWNYVIYYVTSYILWQVHLKYLLLHFYFLQIITDMSTAIFVENSVFVTICMVCDPAPWLFDWMDTSMHLILYKKIFLDSHCTCVFIYLSPYICD